MTTTAGIRPTLVHDTTLGPVTLSASPQGLTRLRFGHPSDPARTSAPVAGSPEQRLLDRAVEELDEYLLGLRTDLEVPVDLSGVGPPHRAVLDALRQVGYGRTAAYAELARTAGLVTDGPRRAGAACARNPVLVVVPCHRIVASGGALTGYAGGLPIKRALLALERGQFSLDTAVPAG